MAALSERKIEIVRTLVAAAPDPVVGSLQRALAETSEQSALGGVRRLVEGEVAERTLRNTVLQPIVALCSAADAQRRSLAFPPRALALIWRGLRATQSHAIARAEAVASDGGSAQLTFAAYADLTAAAAAGLRERGQADFRMAADLCNEAAPRGAEQLARCLDIAPVVRRATQRLSEWVIHPGGETTAAARLAYRDAVEISDDAGPRFFEMLSAQMAHPWMVLRIISAVMDRPAERYLADSELGVFGERIFDDVEVHLQDIAALDADQGRDAGVAAARTVEQAVQKILELETSVGLQRDGVWGLRVGKVRARLANLVDARLRAAQQAVADCLPSHPPVSRTRRGAPKLAVPPDPKLEARALTLLVFCEGLRTTADYGGFSATRAKLLEKLAEHLDHYVEDLLDMIRSGEAADPSIVAAFLEVAAKVDGLVRGASAGDLIRRRAHTALHPEPVSGTNA